MNDRLHRFPRASQKYLETTYGIPPYSDRHVEVLVAKGIYPAPIRISPRRRANRQSSRRLRGQSPQIPSHLSKNPASPTADGVSVFMTPHGGRNPPSLNGGQACK
jgi:hypothetical protein